jgi:NTE family protein
LFQTKNKEQSTKNSQMPTSPHPTIGLALSGGAARGMAHVGVLRALIENKISIDYIGGTSAGAIVGGAYAAGMQVEEIAELGRTLRWRKVGRLTVSRLGILSNKRLETFLRKRLPVSRFEDLVIPFAAVATDLKTGAAVVFRDEGDLPFAIRASCTIPGWYVPIADEQGRQLVDGGLVSVIPATVTRDLGADLVITVDVNSAGATFFGATGSVIGIVLQSLLVVQKTSSRNQIAASDLVIIPQIGHIRWDQVRRADELMDAGYAAAMEAMPNIFKLLESSSLKSAAL